MEKFCGGTVGSNSPNKGCAGLLFAAMEIDGRDVVTYYNYILNVQDELGVDVITATEL